MMTHCYLGEVEVRWVEEVEVHLDLLGGRHQGLLGYRQQEVRQGRYWR
jgi:hypothetical protein